MLSQIALALGKSKKETERHPQHLNTLILLSNLLNQFLIFRVSCFKINFFHSLALYKYGNTPPFRHAQLGPLFDLLKILKQGAQLRYHNFFRSRKILIFTSCCLSRKPRWEQSKKTLPDSCLLLIFCTPFHFLQILLIIIQLLKKKIKARLLLKNKRHSFN